MYAQVFLVDAILKKESTAFSHQNALAMGDGVWSRGWVGERERENRNAVGGFCEVPESWSNARVRQASLLSHPALSAEGRDS